MKQLAERAHAHTHRHNLKASPPFSPSVSVSFEIRFAILHMRVCNFVHVQGTLVSLKLTSGVFLGMGDEPFQRRCAYRHSQAQLTDRPWLSRG